MLRVAYIVKTLKTYRIPLFSRMQEFRDILSLFIFDAKPEKYEMQMLKSSPINYQIAETIKLSWIPFAQNRFKRTIPINIFSQLIRFKPDVVFCPEYSLESLLAVIYGKLKGCRLVVWSSLTEYDERITFPGQLFVRSFIRRYADAYVCYSHLAMKYLQSKNVPEQKCFLVENCTDVRYFFERYQQKEGRYADPIRILYVGAIVKEKGLWDLFYALAGLLHISWTLTLAGEGIAQEELKAFSSENMSDRVLFLGSKTRDELPEIYHRADLVVFPSHSDVWGHVVDEAMASGCCVLASDRTIGALELIQNGKNGYLFKTGDVTDLQRSIAELCNNPTRLIDAGTNAHENMKHHNEDVSVKGLKQAIEYVCPDL